MAERSLKLVNRQRGSTDSEAPVEIPDKLFFSIGEVCKLVKVEPYVLRFWESEFPRLKPGERAQRPPHVPQAGYRDGSNHQAPPL